MRAQIRVGNRVILSFIPDGPDSKLPISELLDTFVYVDPRDGFSRIQTYSLRDLNHGEPEYSFPRGGFRRVKDWLDEQGIEIEIKDERTKGDFSETGFARIPPHNVVLWPLQVQAVEALLARQNCLLRAPTGCITGDALIGVNRSGIGRFMPLAHVVHMFNGGIAGGKCWDPEIQTLVRAPMSDGSVRLRRLIGAKDSGLREVFEVTLASGRQVKATCDHKFLTTDGWVSVRDIGIGHRVLYEVGTGKPIRRTENYSKNWYQLRVLREHPFAGRRGVNPTKGGWTVPVHRLVAEAKLNGLSLEEFVDAVRSRDRTLVYLDPKEWVVHHVDGNSRNNSPDNLRVLTRSQHNEEHRNLHIANISTWLQASEVQSIVFKGWERTYDLEVEEAHAFMANGIAVHNSGKSTIALATIAKANVPALVIVQTGGLRDQWIERCQKELGLDRDQVGVIGDGESRIGPVTIGMNQTIYRRMREGHEDAKRWLKTFGMVVFDEVHGAAAPTVQESIEPFPAKYRIGVSANETRKDQMEFLIYDLFGKPVADIQMADVIQAGNVMDVEVRIIPTEFAAPWYREMVSRGGLTAKIAFNKLLAQMTKSEARNKLILEAILWEVRHEKAQAIVLTHRREHAMRLDALLTQCGLRTGTMLGGTTGRQTFQATSDGIRKGTVDAAIGTLQAIGQGIDLPSVEAGFVVTPLANNKQKWGQARGRICRISKGKNRAVIYYMHDVSVYGRKAVENLASWNSNVVVLHGGQWVSVDKYIDFLKGRVR